MLDDLRRIIESEMEYDDLNDIMMEATDNSIAAMFIEEDGEAIISDSEVMSILEKIPDYDEEAAMNKKLARIAEAYIPEELEYEEVEEGFASKKMLKNYSEEQLEEKMRNLENEIEDLNHVVNSDEGTKKDKKRLEKAKKELADVERLYKWMREQKTEATSESWDDCDEDIVEEGFINRLNMRKWTVDQLKEELDNIEEEIRELEEKEERDKKDEKRLKRAKKELADVKHLINVKSERVQESYEEDDYDFLYEAFGLEKLKKKKVDIEVIYDDDILYVHAYTAGSDYNDSDLVDQYQVDTPEKLQVDHSREHEDMPKGEFDKQIFAAVRKAIKKPLAKKGFKIAKMFMH